MRFRELAAIAPVLALTMTLSACGTEGNDGDMSVAVAVETDSGTEIVEMPDAASSPSPRVAFELSDMEGVMRSSTEWDGKPKLLNFWATWCAPCRREIPLLKDTQEAQGDSLQVIGIAVDFMDDVVAYAEDAQFNYPILVGETDAMEVAESSGVPFIGLPFTMIVAASGELIDTHVGEIEAEHIDQITAVLDEMDEGTLDLAGARERLRNL